MTQPAPAYWSCDCCNREFGRKEHLERHMHRHSKLKPFRCILCTESFARKDTLLRHSTVHGQSGHEIRQNLVNQSKRSLQACHNCAKSKQRCQGASPCSRCIKKGLACQMKTNRPSLHLRNANSSASHDLDGLPITSTASRTPTAISLLTDPPEPETASSRSSPSPQPSPTIDSNASHEQMPIPNCLITPDSEPAIPSQGNDSVDTENEALLGADFDYHTQAQEIITQDVYYSTDAWSTDFSGLFMSPVLWTSCPDDTNQEDLLTQSNREVLGDDCLATSEGQDSGVQGVDQMVGQIVGSKLMPMSDDTARRRHEAPVFQITLADEDVIACENFCHVDQINPASYSSCEQFHAQLQDPQKLPLPGIRVMYALVELYFEYFDHDYPCIHPNQFEQDDASWILLLAVTSVGAQYSALPRADEHVRGLQFLLELAVKENIPSYCRNASLCFVQSVLIRDINRSFSGRKSQQTKLEYERNLLFTLQRAVNSKHQALQRAKTSTLVADSADNWDAWFNAEAVVRLNLCISRLQNLQFALFDLRPVVRDFGVSQQSLQPTARWTCRNDEEWARRRHLPLLHTEAQTYSEVTHLMASISVERIQRIDRISDMSLARHLQAGDSNGYANSGSMFVWSQTVQPMEHRSGFASPLVSGLLNKRLSDFTTGRADGDPAESADYLLHIMAILRHVPLRVIYAYSGWEADESEMKDAETFLLNWMQDHQRSVRTCLWHASSSLRILRNKTQFSCSDPFVILIAGLVVWTYCKLGPCAGDTNYEANHQNPKERTAPTRIDRLSNESDINSWIDGENSAIHLTGFGVLTGPESAHRVIAELDKILRSKIGWKVIRHELAYHFRQIAAGQLPAFREEQDQ